MEILLLQFWSRTSTRKFSIFHHYNYIHMYSNWWSRTLWIKCYSIWYGSNAWRFIWRAKLIYSLVLLECMHFSYFTFLLVWNILGKLPSYSRWNSKTGQESVFIVGWIFIFPSFIQAVLIIIGIFIIVKSKSHLYIDSTTVLSDNLNWLISIIITDIISVLDMVYIYNIIYIILYI